MTDKNKRGGLRPGAGRPRIPGRELTIPLSVSVPEKLKMRVEYESKKRGITTSKYVCEALQEKINFDTEMDKIKENDHD